MESTKVHSLQWFQIVHHLLLLGWQYVVRDRGRSPAIFVIEVDRLLEVSVVLWKNVAMLLHIAPS
jgi:hypothetical protein